MAKKLIVKFPNDAEYEQLKKDAYKHEMNISSYIRYLVAKEREEMCIRTPQNDEVRGMKWKTETGRRKKSLLDNVYGKEFVDELRKAMDIKERRELKERLKEVIRKCHRQSWG